MSFETLSFSRFSLNLPCINPYKVTGTLSETVYRNIGIVEIL